MSSICLHIYTLNQYVIWMFRICHYLRANKRRIQWKYCDLSTICLFVVAVVTNFLPMTQIVWSNILIRQLELLTTHCRHIFSSTLQSFRSLGQNVFIVSRMNRDGCCSWRHHRRNIIFYCSLEIPFESAAANTHIAHLTNQSKFLVCQRRKWNIFIVFIVIWYWFGMNSPASNFVQLYLSISVRLKFSASDVCLHCLKNGWHCRSCTVGRSFGYLKSTKNKNQIK